MTTLYCQSAVSARSETAPLTDRFMYWLLLLLAVMMPFEVIQYRPHFLGMEWTNLEVLLGVTLLFWLSLQTAHLYREGVTVTIRRVWRERSAILLPAILWGALALLSLLLAPLYPVESLKFLLRLGSGFALFLAIPTVVTTPDRLRGVIFALLAGVGLSALLGIAEQGGVAALEPLLALFKETPTLVGGTLRVSASFQYATVTAMYYEMVIPLALVASVATAQPAARRAALLVALLGTLVVVLTLTRTGMVTLFFVCLAFLGAGLLHPPLRAILPSALATLVALILAITLFFLLNSSFRARFTTENDLNWYRATYAVPASLTLATSDGTEVDIVVRNTGEATWNATGQNAFALGYHWWSADGEHLLDLPQSTFPLPRDVAPGEEVVLPVVVTPAPPPGVYLLRWSMLQHNILWFFHRGVPEGETVVEIEEGAIARGQAIDTISLVDERDFSTLIPPTVPRRELWRAALLMWRDFPLLGAGPDNYRRLYGHYLGMQEWDERLYANNLYLEGLATFGLLGSAAFAWLLLSAVSPLIRLLRYAPLPVLLWGTGIIVALGTFLVHGLLDYFLFSTSVSLLFWMLLALAVTLSTLVTRSRSHA